MALTDRTSVPLAEQRPGRGRRRRPLAWALALVVLLGLGLTAYTLVGRVSDTLAGERCSATALGTSVTFDPEQTANAATIAAIAQRRGLPPRAATIAIATAIQESKLRNIRYGDRDSLGLFQQRPSQGWGTEEQVLDPDHATNAFYDALVKVRGWQDGEITVVAQEVQRSAYPEAYADHEQEGRILASTLSGYSPAGLGCRLAEPTSADPQGLSTRLAAELGVEPRVEDGAASVRAGSAELAWAAGAWSVANAQTHGVTRVQVGDRVWQRSRGESSWSWQAADEPLGDAEVRVTF